MPRKSKDLDVLWFLPGRRKPCASTTVATSDLIVALAHDNEGASVKDVHDMVHFDMEAKNVLAIFIESGFGDTILSTMVRPENS